MKNKQVAIVGAGPAGIISSLLLKKSMDHVLIFEKDEHVKNKVCTGLFSKKTTEQIKEFANIEKAKQAEHNNISVYMENYIDKNKIIDIKTKMFVYDRNKIDELLFKKAKKQGVEFRFNKQIKNKKELEKFNIVVGADGPNSKIASIYNFPKIKKFVITKQAIVKNKTGIKDIKIVLSKNTPGFFSWFVPINKGMAKIGAGWIGRKRNIKLNSMFGIDEKMKFEYAIIPIEKRKKWFLSQNNKNIFLIGDSAGQVKKLSGGGFFYITESAKILARNIENGKLYKKQWMQKFGAIDLAHGIVVKMLQKGIENNLIIKLRPIIKYLEPVFDVDTIVKYKGF